MSNEDDLIRRAQAGDVEAFCALAQAHERRIYALAYHYCRETEDAEDLSQEVWLKAYAAVRTFSFESSFYTWLRKITINSFLNYQRKTRPWHRLTDSFQDEQTTTSTSQRTTIDFEPALQNQLVVEKVMRALAEVTPQQRLVFLLKHLEGMTYEEIARELDCSAGTIKKSISRTIKKLREKLGVREEPENLLSYTATGLLR
ncbi:MAG TPA: sigma-70 family RNA polymerase sigma factor [Pyrinomonadaceae bacterium]|nr:sigma-70 family RNA polymerase sigma factor [Pyrinomonadaceae bacterium]